MITFIHNSFTKDLHHDVWFERSRTRENKAILISKLEACVNKLKAMLLEMRAFEGSNVKLSHDLYCAKQYTKTWMFISTISVLNAIISIGSNDYMILGCTIIPF